MGNSPAMLRLVFFVILDHIKCTILYTSRTSTITKRKGDSVKFPAVYTHRAVVELNTWLASAGEDGEDEGCNGKTDTSGVCLDRVRLDLDPLGFECGAFHDLSVGCAYWGEGL